MIGLSKQFAQALCVVLMLSSYSCYAKKPASSAMGDSARIIQQVEQQYKGKVLKITPQTTNGQTVYVIKLLQNSGQIKMLTVPARH